MTKSSACPQLLFACCKNGEVFFFSSPQPQNPDENSSPVAAKLLTYYPLNFFYRIFRPISGLVGFIDKQTVKERKVTIQVICNPSTGQSFTLPKVKTRRVRMVSYFGYDPIENKFKILSMSWPSYGRNKVFEKHQVLTLGSGKLSWRMIDCDIPHYSEDNGICIKGILYYRAIHRSTETNIIVCFDVRSEKFSFIKVMETMITAVLHGSLINYNGKLASIHFGNIYFINGSCSSVQLWILEDIEKQEWSEHIYALPASWVNLVGKALLMLVGVNRSNEIVLSSYFPPDPFYLFYFNHERNTIIRVETQGMDDESFKLHTFLDHVESVELI